VKNKLFEIKRYFGRPCRASVLEARDEAIMKWKDWQDFGGRYKIRCEAPCSSVLEKDLTSFNEGGLAPRPVCFQQTEL
jgi:hypothetical protein